MVSSPAMLRRVMVMGSLVFAGESIYMLPYALRRDFQSTMIEEMGLTNLELGSLNSIFGILALLTYFPGGWLADRVSARRLLTFSLLSTGLGGFYMATLPGYAGLVVLYSFWGICSILTFWAAFIKTTRAWGGEARQGQAFGILDGGRGVVSAGLAFIGIAFFAGFHEPGHGLQSVIGLYSFASIASAALTWVFIPDDIDTLRASSAPQLARESTSSRHTPVRAILSMPVVWLHALVILTAYMGYWGTFDISAFAVDAWGRDQLFGATVSASAVWLRPISAIGVGLVADKVSPSRAVIACFCSLIGTFTVFALTPTEPGLIWLLWTNTAAIAVAVFALRGLYFALLEECKFPMASTGTVVGVISVIGYTPDIFTPLISGWLLDRYPGATGHQLFFGILAGAAVLGLVSAFVIRRLNLGGTHD